MDAVKFILERGRMCKGCERCSECPIGKVKGKYYCDYWEFDHPTEAIAIVEKWSEEHPLKTYKDDFLEKYPNARIGDTGVPVSCVRSVFGSNTACELSSCKECWNQPMMEVK